MTTSGYSEGELLQMQQDAIRRVKQMQERAKVNLQAQQSDWNSPTIGQGQGQPAVPVLQPIPQGGRGQNQNQNQNQGQRGMAPRGSPNQQWNNGQQRSPAPAPPSNAASGGLGSLGGLSSLLSGGSSPLSGLLGAIGGDRILILLLMVVLLGEEGDQTLILALCYLLLFD